MRCNQEAGVSWVQIYEREASRASEGIPECASLATVGKEDVVVLRQWGGADGNPPSYFWQDRKW